MKHSRNISVPLITGICGILILVINLFLIQVVDIRHLTAEATSQSQRTTILHGLRGTIYDRNGEPLSLSRKVKHLTLQPYSIDGILHDIANTPQHPYFTCGDSSSPVVYEQYMTRLLHYLSSVIPTVDVPHLQKDIAAKPRFLYLAKNVSPATAQKIIDKCPLIGAEDSTQRLYPNSALATNIIGVANTRGGVSGLEHSFNTVLSPVDGRIVTKVSADGTPLPFSRDEHPAQPGRSIVTTLDSALQTIVQSETEDYTRYSGARSGHTLVMDGWTGDILALADSGTFTPDIPLGEQAQSSFATPSLTSPFEPGSIAKLITFTSAFEHNITTPGASYTVPGMIDIDGLTVHDAWVHGPTPMTTRDMFAQSSNVGTLILAQKLGEQNYWSTFKKFPLGVSTDIGIAGETSGLVTPHAKWQPGAFGNFPIGQGFSISLIQMASMYQPFAHNGVILRPTLVSAEETRHGHWTSHVDRSTSLYTQYGHRIVSQSTVTKMLQLMEGVFSHPLGTAHQMMSPADVMRGKTGTAQQVDPTTGRYSTNMYWSTFAGLANDTSTGKPRYVIAVMLDNPVRGQSAYIYAHLVPYLSSLKVSQPFYMKK